MIGLASADGGIEAGWGAALCLVAAVAYAGGVIAQKPLLERTSALQITLLACVIGAVACLPFAATLVDEAGAAPRIHDSPGWSTWACSRPRSASRPGRTRWSARAPGRMGATTYLVPPVAVLMAWALLGETPPALALPAASSASPACT